MSRHLDRLRSGEHWWAAEFALRSLGLAMLAGCYRLGLFAHRLAVSAPPHQTTPGEFAICLGIVLLLASGIALPLFGTGLFEEMPIPRSSAWYWRNAK